jgi:hypothetical protein
VKKCNISDKTLEQKCIEAEAEKQKRLAERSVYPSGHKYQGMSIFIDEKGIYNLGADVMRDEINNRIIVELHVLDYMKRCDIVDKKD